jgi:hypothetical protein
LRRIYAALPYAKKLPFLPVYTEASNAVPGDSGMPFGALANDNLFQIGLRSLPILTTTGAILC